MTTAAPNPNNNTTIPAPSPDTTKSSSVGIPVIEMTMETRQSSKNNNNSNSNNDNTNNNNNSSNNKGNLHSLLKAYDQTHNNQDNISLGGTTATGGVIESNLSLGLGGVVVGGSNSNNNNGVGLGPTGSSDSISLQLDHLGVSVGGGGGRDRSSTLGSIRERGLTFGSEFDFGLGLTNENVSSDTAVFDLSVVNGQKHNVVSAGNSNGSGGNIMNMNVNAGSSGVSVTGIGGGGGGKMGMGMGGGNSNVIDNNSQASTSGFLNKMFNNNTSSTMNNATSSSTTQPIPVPQSTSVPKNVMKVQQGRHTPPSATATSYETKHFGKRVRSGVSFTYYIYIYICIRDYQKCRQISFRRIE